MKFSAAIIVILAATASAFSPAMHSKPTLSLRMAEQGEVSETPMAPVADSNAQSNVKTMPKMSQALPFMERPAALDGSLVGDVGFDPLGFAKSKDDLINYREAEIKHARLAMLVR